MAITMTVAGGWYYDTINTSKISPPTVNPTPSTSNATSGGGGGGGTTAYQFWS